MTEDENGKIARVEIKSLQHLYAELVTRMEAESREQRDKWDALSQRLEIGGKEQRERQDALANQITEMRMFIANKRFVTTEQCSALHKVTDEKYDAMRGQIERWRGSLKVLVALSTGLGFSTVLLAISRFWP